jgi:hypothetical protein
MSRVIGHGEASLQMTSTDERSQRLTEGCNIAGNGHLKLHEIITLDKGPRYKDLR